MRNIKIANLFACVAGLLIVLSACAPAAAPATTPPMAATASSANDFSFANVSFSLPVGILTGASGQAVPEQGASGDAAWWSVHPQYTSISLEGYPVTKSVNAPVIAVYPVDEYRRLSEQASKTIDALAKYLADKSAGTDPVPALPLRNDLQVFHSNVKFLSFGSGSGVRFLAFYSQGPVPLNNREIFYAFQGLTSDGKYVVTAMLPVNHPDLPADSDPQAQQTLVDALQKDPQYWQKLSETFNAKADDSFTPALSALDGLMSSIRIGQ